MTIIRRLPHKIITPQFSSLTNVILHDILQTSGGNYASVSKQFRHCTEFEGGVGSKEKEKTDPKRMGDILVTHAKRGIPPDMRASLPAISAKVFRLDICFGDRPESEFPALHEIADVASFFSRVHEIRLSGKHVHNEFVANIVNSFPRVTHFSIYDSDEVNAPLSAGVNAIRLAEFRAVQFRNCKNIYTLFDGAFSYPYAPDSLLTRLDISNCPKLVKQSLTGLWRLRALRYLRASHFYKIDDTFAELRRRIAGLETEKAATSRMRRYWNVCHDGLLWAEEKKGPLTLAACVIGLVVLKTIFDEQERLAEIPCQSLIPIIPWAKGHACTVVQEQIAHMGTQTRAECVERYLYAWQTRFASLCQNFTAPPTSSDIAQQRSFVHMSMQSTLLLKGSYVESALKYIGKEINLKVKGTDVRGLLPTLVKDRATEHCSWLFRSFSDAVQNLCHANNTSDLTSVLQTIDDQALWPTTVITDPWVN